MMIDQPGAREPFGPFREEELLVAQQHQRMVQDVLKDLGVTSKVADTSDLLGLTKLEIVVRQIKAADLRDSFLRSLGPDRKEEAHARWDRRLPSNTAQASLDQVLWALREVFAARYAGWNPTMGKNRFIAQVHGVGEVIHGGGEDPKPMTEKETAKFKDRADGRGRGVTVGVLDTSIYAHRWLSGGWTASFPDTLAFPDPVTDTAPPFAQGHATFVTGLILRQAPEASVKVRRILGKDGVADSWEAAKAIVEFGRSGLDVLNLSFACHTVDGEQPLAMAAAIDRLDPDLVVVAAAGNHGRIDPERNVFDEVDTRWPAWPAALDDVIAVGATDEGGRLAEYSPDLWWVDVVTQGTNVPSTYLPAAAKQAKPATPGGPVGKPKVVTFPNAYARWTGTSFAAALVAGAIAAQVEPGRVSARQAAHQVLDDLERLKPARPGSPAPLFLPPPSFEA